VLRALGVAALAGVAAGGVLVARDERRRAAYTPDEVRERLHARLARAEGAGEAADDGGLAGGGGVADDGGLAGGGGVADDGGRPLEG